MSGETKVVYIHLTPVVDIETGECLEINRDEISEIKSDSGRKGGLLFAHHKTGKIYRQVRTLDEIEEAWFDYGFQSFDSTNVTNMNLVKAYDEYRGRLYFEDHPNEDSNFSSVAAVHKGTLKSTKEQYGFRILLEEEKQLQPNPIVIRGTRTGMA